MTWRCKICRCEWTTAVERSIERGTRLQISAVTCSPECGVEWQRRQARKFGRERYRRKERGARWTCSVCGAGKAKAERRRERLGLGPLRGHSKTCSEECRAERNRRSRCGELPRPRGMRPFYRKRSR